jgi:hypothetical protein
LNQSNSAAVSSRDFDIFITIMGFSSSREVEANYIEIVMKIQINRLLGGNHAFCRMVSCHERQSEPASAFGGHICGALCIIEGHTGRACFEQSIAYGGLPHLVTLKEASDMPRVGHG